jgi:hypothetical protein
MSIEIRVPPEGAAKVNKNRVNGMSDIVSRLRQMQIDATEMGGEPHVSEVCGSAADRIAELEARNTSLSNALVMVLGDVKLRIAAGELPNVMQEVIYETAEKALT